MSDRRPSRLLRREVVVVGAVVLGMSVAAFVRVPLLPRGRR